MSGILLIRQRERMTDHLISFSLFRTAPLSRVKTTMKPHGRCSLIALHSFAIRIPRPAMRCFNDECIPVTIEMND